MEYELEYQELNIWYMNINPKWGTNFRWLLEYQCYMNINVIFDIAATKIEKLEMIWKTV